MGYIASQYPNKRVIVLRDDGEIETEDEDDTDFMPPLEDADKEEYPAQGDLLLARRALSTQVKEDEECNEKTSFILGATFKT
ncbi:hypothetical protein PanWU01x14_037970, partial [Parasponia andersonii]